MNEIPKFESEEEVSRERVIEAYKKVVERGIRNPKDLDFKNREVREANNLFHKWLTQEKKKGEKGDLEIIKLHIDAGFNDPSYLEDVLNRLVEQIDKIQKNNPLQTKLYNDIAEEINKIHGLLGK